MFRVADKPPAAFSAGAFSDLAPDFPLLSADGHLAEPLLREKTFGIAMA